eukprot:768716-Hanusia_phi.AAC.2
MERRREEGSGGSGGSGNEGDRCWNENELAYMSACISFRQEETVRKRANRPCPASPSRHRLACHLLLAAPEAPAGRWGSEVGCPQMGPLSPPGTPPTPARPSAKSLPPLPLVLTCATAPAAEACAAAAALSEDAMASTLLTIRRKSLTGRDLPASCDAVTSTPFTCSSCS